ncbi:atpase synthesis protein 25 [Stemphylium lycopersici]|uniref:ATPase synthesis protein 25 n=1 Tax=Stemphylium lycopersici TaxID=183478 RepID=A0A364N9I3_STELY|nr:atpase synthesis protein 25 [Stemphylium lycopersici]RAR13823.1 atpase synthesis protein 25 [Stemphylium lycopersici]
MSLSRAASSRFVCNACRNIGARSSTTIPLSSRVALRASPPKLSQCALSTSAPRGVQENDATAADPDFAFLHNSARRTNVDSESHDSTISADELEETVSEAATANAPSTAPDPPAKDASIPWYLRQQSSVQSPVQQPAEIPDLPPNPPPLLETLLEYVSVTAGLDDLQLLDLRDLDPPPALGAKLIMIIATARSEKHLHVAADRFCRYLRREHGLKANAAGLLGRNELKIKLRRKAKRMRMLANVGGTMPEGNIDDGIRTGWICCTLGKLEAHPQDTRMPGDDVKEFVGFRDVRPGVNVVVQMFTEEKRAETDLETLWGGVVRTHQRKDKTADEALRELEEDIEDLEEDVDESHYEARHTPQGATKQPIEIARPATPPTPARQMHRPRPTAGDAFPPASAPDSRRQIRRLHTVGL